MVYINIAEDYNQLWHEQHARIWNSLMHANRVSSKVREEEKETVLHLAMPVRGLTVLDIGTGTGRFAREYLSDSASRLVGIDVAENMLLEARKNCEEFSSKCEFTRMSVHNLEFPTASFDFVSCIGVIEHCGNEKKAVEQISRVLKPRGKIIIASANGHYILKKLVHSYEKRTTGLPKYFHREEDFSNWFQSYGIKLEETRFCGLSRLRHLAVRIVVKGTKAD